MFNTFVIVEDHLLFAQALSGLVQTVSGMKCLRILTTGTEAIEQISTAQPGLILLDLNLPDINGLEVLKQLRKQGVETPVLIISMLNDPLVVTKAVEAGASGFIPKNTSTEELKRAFDALSEDSLYIPQDLRESMESLSTERALEPPAILHSELSKRELEIIRLISMGHTNKEISELIFISPLTVKTHRSNILRKLDIKNTAALISYAKNMGII